MQNNLANKIKNKLKLKKDFILRKKEQTNNRKMQNTYLENEDLSRSNRFKNMSGVSIMERPSSLNRANMQYNDTDFDRMLMPETYGSINEIVPLNDDE